MLSPIPSCNHFRFSKTAGLYGPFTRPVWQPLYRQDGELPNGPIYFSYRFRIQWQDMSRSTEPNIPKPALDASSVPRLLLKFSDTDSLFSRPSISVAQDRRVQIPLQRFQELEQDIRNNPATAEPYVELGQIYVGQERWCDAKRVLESGALACPDHEPLLMLREDLLLQQANQILEQVKTKHAQDPTEQHKYDLEQADVNFANERIRVCRDRYGRHPDHKEILITWAIALRQLARIEDAIELLNTASASAELRSRASLQLGMCYQTLNRPLDALAAFRKAALYRDPPPEMKIRRRALELALDLSEATGLIDSSLHYAKHLLEVCEQADRRAIELRIKHFETLEK